MPGKRKVRIYSEDGNKVKLVQRRSGKTVKTTVSPDGKNKERQVRSKYDDVNNTGGNIIKTVTRMPGSVEKEIERGNKRIEVQKYKDEGIKSRTVINMKKNDQYKKDNSSDLEQNPKTGKMSIKGTPVKDLVKNSAFRNLPSPMVEEAAKPENNVLPANRMDARQQKANQPMINKLNKMSLKQRKENK